MTIAEWLDTRDPEPPEPLGQRLRTALAPVLERDAVELPEAALDAAEDVLRALLDRGCAGRDQALDLLAADALVTYAFEAASDDPERIGERAERAMLRIAALVSPDTRSRDARSRDARSRRADW